jgi:hypothetical protein
LNYPGEKIKGWNQKYFLDGSQATGQAYARLIPGVSDPLGFAAT